MLRTWCSDCQGAQGLILVGGLQSHKQCSKKKKKNGERKKRNLALWTDKITYRPKCLETGNLSLQMIFCYYLGNQDSPSLMCTKKKNSLNNLVKQKNVSEFFTCLLRSGSHWKQAGFFPTTATSLLSWSPRSEGKSLKIGSGNCRKRWGLLIIGRSNIINYLRNELYTAWGISTFRTGREEFSFTTTEDICMKFTWFRHWTL